MRAISPARSFNNSQDRDQGGQRPTAGPSSGTSAPPQPVRGLARHRGIGCGFHTPFGCGRGYAARRTVGVCFRQGTWIRLENATDLHGNGLTLRRASTWPLPCFDTRQPPPSYFVPQIRLNPPRSGKNLLMPVVLATILLRDESQRLVILPKSPPGRASHDIFIAKHVPQQSFERRTSLANPPVTVHTEHRRGHRRACRVVHLGRSELRLRHPDAFTRGWSEVRLWRNSCLGGRRVVQRHRLILRGLEHRQWSFGSHDVPPEQGLAWERHPDRCRR